MSFSGLDWLTAGLSVVAFVLHAGTAIHKHKFAGKKPTGKAWVFWLSAIALRYWLGDDGFLVNTVAVCRDTGIGLFIGAMYRQAEYTPAKRTYLVAALFLAVWLGWTYRAAFPFGTDSGHTAELLVELGPDDTIAELKDILDAHDATYERAFPNVDMSEDEDLAQFFIIRCPSAHAEALTSALRADTENVDSAEANAPVQLGPELVGERTVTPLKRKVTNDPELAAQWGLAKAAGHDAIHMLYSNKPQRIATVAILDTGVDATHEDIVQVFKASPADNDGHGHGTHCAGVAGAVANNKLGMASLNIGGRYVRITSYAALSPRGRGTIETIAQAIIDAAEDGADVISMSLGGRHPQPPTVYVEAVQYAMSKGAIVVAAAGNSGQDAAIHSPANVPGVITVAALGRNGGKASFSNTNTTLARPIAAPGVGILSLKPGGLYVSMSGTSMATPLVAGLLGVMRSLRPDLSAADAYEILVVTGTDGANANRVGRSINMEKALQAVLR